VISFKYSRRQTANLSDQTVNVYVLKIWFFFKAMKRRSGK
jgi:hypothetical protein